MYVQAINLEARVVYVGFVYIVLGEQSKVSARVARNLSVVL